MKKLLLVVVGSTVCTLLLAGCGSPAAESVSPEQRAQQQSEALKKLPPQAQALAAQQAQKQQIQNAMRAKDAAAAKQP